MRGIGVALKHQHIDRFALVGQREPFAHAETMLFVDHGERQRLEDHVVLDQRMGADQEIDLAGFQPRQDFAPLLALLAAGQDRHAQAGAFGQRRDGLDMLAREDFGRRHQRGLLAGLDDRSGGEQRHHRLAGADVALQQPQHPHRLAQILGDGGDRLALRGRQRIGQGVDDLVAQMAVAGVAVAGRTPQLRAHQRQRQLAGQQFVEGKPRPERAIGQDVGEFDRHMHAVQRFADRRKAAAANDFRADPLGQIRQLLQRLRDRAAQRAQREAFGERIDRVDAAEFCKSRLVHDAVGMHDLRNAVVHLQRAGNVALLADRQQLFDIAGLGAEERQHHVAGIVARHRRGRARGNCAAAAGGGDRR